MIDPGKATRSSRRIFIAAAAALILSMAGIFWVLIEQNEALRTVNYERSAIAPFQLRTHLNIADVELQRIAHGLPNASRDRAVLEFDIFMERLISLEFRPPYPALLTDDLADRYQEIRALADPLDAAVNQLRDAPEGEWTAVALDVSSGLAVLDARIAALASLLNQKLAEGRQAEADSVLFSIRALMVFLAALFLIAGVLAWVHLRNVGSLSDANVRLTRLTEELARAREVAERANVAKSKFLAGMSHELRTPLNAIIGFSDIIRTGGDAVPADKAREYAEDIHMSGTHLLALVNSILDTSRIEAGTISLELRPTELGPILDEVSDMLAVSLRRKDITLNRRNERPLLRAVPVNGDANAIRQMVINLVSNAIKFTEPGGEIGIDLGQPQKDQLAVTVWDKGIGIPADVLPRLGTPFEQGRDAGKHVDPISLMPGVGLGLSITKALVEQHGGALSIESQEGAGSRFTITFQCSKTIPEQAGTEPVQ